MSRFVNLEFEGHSESDSELTGFARDEKSWLAEAERAFAQPDFEKALRYFSKVLEFNPQNATAWTGQVQALIELGEYREAKLWADKALERLPREPELLAAKAVALGRSGDVDGAIAFSDASIEERGDTPYVWLARGDVLLARQERRADYCLDKALLLAPRNWLVAWLAARIRFFYKQFALALQLAQRAIEWNASQSAAWLMAGLCQKELGMVGSARASFAQAAQLNPQCQHVTAAMIELSQTGVGSRLAGWCRRLFARPSSSNLILILILGEGRS
jgi:tetratricopeptide (TPR) repeat protein